MSLAVNVARTPSFVRQEEEPAEDKLERYAIEIPRLRRRRRDVSEVRGLLSPVAHRFLCRMFTSREDSWRHYKSGGSYPARTPSMSPDGSVIIFSSPRSGNGDIYQVNSDGSSPIRLTSDPSFETDPIFSPDGSSIAFARETNGCRHIWLMNRDGTNLKQLTFGSVLEDISNCLLPMVRSC